MGIFEKKNRLSKIIFEGNFTKIKTTY